MKNMKNMRGTIAATRPCRAAVAAVCFLTAACGNEEPALEETAEPSLSTIQPTIQERGLLLNSGRWTPGAGARAKNLGVPGVVSSEDWFAVYATDNSLLLLAMSLPRYGFSRANGYAAQIRDMVVQSLRPDGRFRLGKMVNRYTGEVRSVDTEPGFPVRAIQGVAHYTAREPEGTPGRGTYVQWINQALRLQHALIMREAVNYTDAGAQAVHLESAAVWANHRERPVFESMARETWGKLRPRQLASGLFPGSTARNIEIYHSILVSRRNLGDLGGMGDALARMEPIFKKGPDNIIVAGATAPCDLVGCYAGRMIDGDPRAFIKHSFRQTRLDDGLGGRMFATGPREEGLAATENQAMGWIGDEFLGE